MLNSEKKMEDDVSKPKIQSEAAKRFYSTGDYSDLTITCQGKEWKVHKFQLCGQSEWFHKACSGDFKEAHESNIALDDDDPQVVEAMLHYLYHGTYRDAGNDPSDLPSILLDVHTFVIADKYFIEPLQDKAVDKFEEHCETEWRTPEFAQAVEELYKTTPQNKTLQGIAITAAKKHLKDLLSDPKRFDDFHRVLQSVPSFSADILGKIDITDEAEKEEGELDLGKPDEFKWSFECPNCHSTFELKISLGIATSIKCPKNGCYSSQDFPWWKRNGKPAKKT